MNDSLVNGTSSIIGVLSLEEKLDELDKKYNTIAEDSLYINERMRNHENNLCMSYSPYISGSYKNKDDCLFLLQDLTNQIPLLSIEEKEELIAKGINYSEVISKEEPVSEEINKIFKNILQKNAKNLAMYTATICEQLYKEYTIAENKNLVLVSLARAGTPIGILMRKYIEYKYNVRLPHYSISIIRDKGIDNNALNYIVDRHPLKENHIVFVDGWTGKGSITAELRKSIKKYNEEHHTNLNDDLVVLADPAKKTKYSGTKKDVCIPNACLNATVCGLISRTIHNSELIGKKDFHGAVYYHNLKKYDYSDYFINEVVKYFNDELIINPIANEVDEDYVENVLAHLEHNFGKLDRNKIKLSIGETSRGLIRRIPKILLVKNLNNPNLEFVLNLAKSKGVEIREFDTKDYECICILK